MTTSEYTGPPPAAPPTPQAGPAYEPLPEPARSSIRRLRGPRSLTAKITAGVVALVVVLVGIIGASTYFALRINLYDRLDSQLDSIASGNQRHFDQCVLSGYGSCTFGGPDGYRAPTTEWIVLLDASGDQVGKLAGTEDGSVRLMALTANQRAQMVAHAGAHVTLTTADGQQLRVSSRGLDAENGPVVVSGLSTDEVSRTLGRLVAVETVIGLGAVALAMVATSFGVRRSLRNLYRVTGTAREVAAELSPTGAGLDRRVPDDEPDTEVGHLATSFNTMLAAVETQFGARLESEQRLRQFLADASHELRTPLTSIRGYAELARMQRAVGDDSSDNLDRIESEGTRMSRLVEDLLMLARGDAVSAGGDASPAGVQESVDVAAMLDDVVSGSRAAFPDRPIELHVEAVPDVIGDRDQLLRAIRNLVTNACVHTEAGRLITVRGFTQGGGVVITVVDGGPGLPPEQAAHVFERFWRADKARTRARGGTGLGMSIVATIVRAHGGSVRFESTVERGSTVTLWLPVTE